MQSQAKCHHITAVTLRRRWHTLWVTQQPVPGLRSPTPDEGRSPEELHHQYL